MGDLILFYDRIYINFRVLRSLFILFLLIPFVFLNTSRASEDITSAKNVIENWDTNDQYSSYAIGVIDGIVSYTQIIDEIYPYNDSKIFCFPDDNMLTNDDHLNLVEAEFIKNKFEYADFDFKVVAMLTLGSLYPC
jgi:hypothetical protein